MAAAFAHQSETIQSAFGVSIPHVKGLTGNDARLMASWLEGAADMLRFLALEKTITAVELGGAERADLRDLVTVFREHQ